MIVESTLYWARDGAVEAVLAQRRAASALRVRLGLPPGCIVRRLDGDGPDVRWECRFATREEHALDLAARTASPEFGTARQAMRALLARFERQVEESVDWMSAR
jgi:hypothetical protein